MFTWAEFTEEVKARLGAEQINPNAEFQSLLTKSIVDGVVELQRLVAALRENHTTEYSPSHWDQGAP